MSSEAVEQLEALSRQLGAAVQEAEAATAALADRDLQLRSERAARASEAYDKAQLVEEAEVAKAAAELLRTENQQLRTDTEQLAAEGQRLAATNQQLAATNKQLVADKQRLAAAAAAAASLTEATAGVAMAALGDMPAGSAPAISALLPPPVAAALAGPTATAYALLATLAVVALAAVLQLRARRAAAAHAVRAASLAARLKETAFARDTAEKSLELLEGELQHRMKQLGDAQQRAADAGGWLGRGVTKAVGTWLAVCHVWAAQCFHWAHLPSLLSVCPLLPTCSLPKDRHRAAAPACAHARQGRAAATPRQPG